MHSPLPSAWLPSLSRPTPPPETPATPPGAVPGNLSHRNAIPMSDPTAPLLMTAPTYEFGYTISVGGETRDCVLKVIGEADRDRYTADANEANWREANLPNVKGVYRQSPSPTTYWVRLASQDQVTDA